MPMSKEFPVPPKDDIEAVYRRGMSPTKYREALLKYFAEKIGAAAGMVNPLPLHNKTVSTEGTFHEPPKPKEAVKPKRLKQTSTPRKVCGAETRSGTPCQNTRLYSSGRCKNHGGLSTGPRTPEGKARSLAALPWFKKRLAASLTASDIKPSTKN